MSLDVYLYDGDKCVFTANITNNLKPMATCAGLFDALWRPEKLGAEKAHQLINPLVKGLAELCARPGFYRKFDSPAGLGKYEDLVEFVSRYLNACGDHKNTTPKAWY